MTRAAHQPAGPRALFVDLNNFSRYPTVGVGYISRALRGAGWSVELLSPLSDGVQGIPREPRATPIRRLFERVNQASAHSSIGLVRGLRNAAAGHGRKRFLASCARVGALVERALQGGQYDAVLISAYLLYYPVCEAIGLLCREHGIPLLIGGSYLNQPEVAGE